MRAERIIDPEFHIHALLKRVDPDQLTALYGIDTWEDADEFLDKFARKSGRLLKGGEPDVKTAAKMLLYDWQRGKILYHSLPPEDECKPDISSEEEAGAEEVVENGLNEAEQ